MPPLLAAMALASRNGVLVKSAVVMECLADTSQVAFDKTGTLTEGTPRVTRVAPAADRWPPDDLLALAAAAEHASEHSVGRAVVAAAREAGIDLRPAHGFASTPGQGVRAHVAGYTIQVGSPTALLASTQDPGSARSSQGNDVRSDRQHLEQTVAELEATGHTAVVVLVDAAPAGVLDWPTGCVLTLPQPPRHDQHHRQPTRAAHR